MWPFLRGCDGVFLNAFWEHRWATHHRHDASAHAPPVCPVLGPLRANTTARIGTTVQRCSRLRDGVGGHSGQVSALPPAAHAAAGLTTHRPAVRLMRPGPPGGPPPSPRGGQAQHLCVSGVGRRRCGGELRGGLAGAARLVHHQHVPVRMTRRDFATPTDPALPSDSSHTGSRAPSRGMKMRSGALGESLVFWSCVRITPSARSGPPRPAMHIWLTSATCAKWALTARRATGPRYRVVVWSLRCRQLA